MTPDFPEVLNAIKDKALAICPDYPGIENADYWEQLYAIHSSYQGTCMANEDLHNLIEKLCLLLDITKEQLVDLSIAEHREASKPLPNDAPGQLALTTILNKVGNPYITSVVMWKYHNARRDLDKLTKYLRNTDIEFYNKMLLLIRQRHMDAVDSIKDKVPKDCHTFLRNCVVGMFREAVRDIEEDVKENVRRVQRGQQPL